MIDFETTEYEHEDDYEHGAEKTENEKEDEAAQFLSSRTRYSASFPSYSCSYSYSYSASISEQDGCATIPDRTCAPRY